MAEEKGKRRVSRLDGSEDVKLGGRAGLLLEINNLIVSNLDIPELLKTVSVCLHKVVDHDFAVLFIYDEEEKALRAHALHSQSDNVTVEEGYLLPLENSVSGFTFSNKKTLVFDRNDLEKFPATLMLSMPHTKDVQSGCSVPLISRGRAVGTITLISFSKNNFTKEKSELVEEVAAQIALAVDNAVSYRTSQKEKQQLGMLLEVNNALVSNLDLRELVSGIGNSLQQIIQYDAVILYLYDKEANHLREHSLDLDPAKNIFEKGLILPIEGSASGKAFATRKMVISNWDELSRLPEEVLKIVNEAGIRSTCSLPLFSGEEVFGVMTFVSSNDDNFSGVSGNLLEQISVQMTIAVVNALSYKKLEREKDRFGMLLDASNALSAVLDLNEVLKTASDTLRKHVHHDFAGVALHDKESDTLRILALENPPENFLDGAATIPIDNTPDGLAFRARKIVRRGRIDTAEFPSPHMQQVREIGINSFCCVPLVSRGRAIGVLAVASLKEHAFDGEDGETIQLIANQLAGAVEAAVQFNEIERLKNQLTGEKLYLEEEIQSEYNFAEIVGCSAALKYVLRQIETVAPTDSCVLLYGETGTGKELISRAIHNLSGRRERTLVKLNCAAIPTGLLESELFGHEKGAFTGAMAPRVGRFELADRGTLLLDEIGDIPLELQPKLLRVLQESEFERLGSSRTIKADVRLIAATNANLPELVEQKKFRSDLYYRLNVFPITVPPLRERREDIPLLTGYFTKKHSLRMRKNIEAIPREAVDALCAYDFPGNIRELENFIERAVILSRGRELELPLAGLNHRPRTLTDDGAPMPTSLEDVERAHITEILKKTNGVIGGKGGAAELLNMPVSTLRHRMKKLGLR